MLLCVSSIDPESSDRPHTKGTVPTGTSVVTRPVQAKNHTVWGEDGALTASSDKISVALESQNLHPLSKALNTALNTSLSTQTYAIGDYRCVVFDSQGCKNTKRYISQITGSAFL
jgi:hypothetical protein